MAGLLQNIKSLRHCEGNFSFPWGFPNLYPTAVALTVLLYKAVVREGVSIIFLTCWKSGCTSMLLEFFAAYHIFFCISACKVSACNQTRESWGLIHLIEDASLSWKNCIWQRWRHWYCTDIIFYFLARFLIFTHVDL